MPVGVTNASGKVLGATRYGAYGAAENACGLQSDFGYAGMLRDPGSNLYLTMFREYDPSVGRWLSRDPIGELGGQNIYAYVGGDPVNGIDPFGLKDCRDKCVGRYAMCSASQDPHSSTFWNGLKFKGCKATVDAAVEKAPSRPAGTAIACQADYDSCTGDIPYGDPELDPKSPLGLKCNAGYLKCVAKGGE